MSKKSIPNQSSFRSHRQKLLAAAAARGRQVNNIWSVYSTKIGKDCVLISDPEYLNFVWMEGDPSIASFEIETELYVVNSAASDGATYPNAIVSYFDGRREWREVNALEDSKNNDERDLRQKRIQERITKDLSYDYLRITPALLKQHWQFLSNWRRAVPFLAAARHLDWSRYADEAHAFVHKNEQVTLGDFMVSYEKVQQPLAIAGALRCAQQGKILTDLAKLPLGPETFLERIHG